MGEGVRDGKIFDLNASAYFGKHARAAGPECGLWECRDCDPEGRMECGHFVERARMATRFHPSNVEQGMPLLQQLALQLDESHQGLRVRHGDR
jgi:hypothetical protein